MRNFIHLYLHSYALGVKIFWTEHYSKFLNVYGMYEDQYLIHGTGQRGARGERSVSPAGGHFSDRREDCVV